MSIKLTPEDDYYYSDAFKTLVRSNKRYLLRACEHIQIVELDFLYVNRNNVYGLLARLPSLNIPTHLLWVTAFLNGITNPNEDISKRTEILKIAPAVIEELIRKQKTTFN